ncbi:disease resistance protein RUN1-like [Eucalyptus grandis]|uniref:disease resistance protein RUN1-like n=1 Tax=Eucalyptus grandis TaxID=71139 RepID=UPI00192EECE1|nr:disease resistance protein RUN1-like [Eucalyptus grandis]
MKGKSVTGHLIGLEDRVKQLTELLDVNHQDARLIGIHGKGGIGKTTIAKNIFNKLSSHFGKCCSFLENIRESFLTKEGILQLQRKLLSDIVGFGSAEQLMDSEQAIRRIGDTLSTKNVLLVLDDVDKKEHIKKLIGVYSLHSGSRIIITTRNKIVLNVKGLKDEILCYEMLKMDDAPALRLFCQHAFGREFPFDIYHGLSNKIVSIMRGLPLAIEVIGSLLNGKDEAFWKEMLDRLREVPEEDIMETLRISFDNLDKYQQQIFLDIACFFYNENKADAIYMWADCQLYPIRGLKVLIDRCLIKILDNDNIWMHDQLIELGRRIVRQESPFNLGKRSRLWITQEALEIIRTKKRKDEIQALKIFRSADPIEITNEEFERLKNLRFLELHWGTYVGDFATCHSNLRWFSWHSPQDFRATNMYLDRLVVCKLNTIDFKDDSKAWDLIKRAQNLKVLSITRCSSITTIPDFSKCSCLERLTLADCFNLERIESFIGDLVSLIELKIEECGGLTELPKELGALVKLKHFSLSGCRGLRELPSSLGNLTSLTELDLSGTNIAKPPRMPLLRHAQEIPPDASDFKSKSDKTEGGEKAIAWWTSKECKQEMEQFLKQSLLPLLRMPSCVGL